MSAAPASEPPPRLSGWRRWSGVVRWLGTALAVAYVAHLVDLRAAGDAVDRISAGALLLAIALVAGNVVVGAVRWRVLMAAYGARTRPPLVTAIRLCFVAFFYNTCLPGAVAGDVVRGVVARESFGPQGTTAALAVVLVERLLGLFAVFALLASGLVAASGLGGITAAPGVGDRGDLAWWAGLGIAGSLAVVVAIPFARRLAPHLPAPLGRIAGRLPALSSLSAFALAAGLSIITQLMVASAGWVLLTALAPTVTFGGSLLLVPLAAATAFLPITVGGAGAREAVYVSLGASLFAMPRSDALVASLALFLAHLVVAAAGGVADVLARRPR